MVADWVLVAGGAITGTTITQVATTVRSRLSRRREERAAIASVLRLVLDIHQRASMRVLFTELARALGRHIPDKIPEIERQMRQELHDILSIEALSAAYRKAVDKLTESAPVLAFQVGDNAVLDRILRIFDEEEEPQDMAFASESALVLLREVIPVIQNHAMILARAHGRRTLRETRSRFETQQGLSPTMLDWLRKVDARVQLAASSSTPEKQRTARKTKRHAQPGDATASS